MPNGYGAPGRAASRLSYRPEGKLSGMNMKPAGVWTYRANVTRGSSVIGYTVEATDGRIGTVDKASDEADASHLVVDTGFWIFGKRRLLPAGVVTTIDDVGRTVSVDMTKDDVKAAPDWDDEIGAGDWRQRYSDYYGPFGT